MIPFQWRLRAARTFSANQQDHSTQRRATTDFGDISTIDCVSALVVLGRVSEPSMEAPALWAVTTALGRPLEATTASGTPQLASLRTLFVISGLATETRVEVAPLSKEYSPV